MSYAGLGMKSFSNTSHYNKRNDIFRIVFLVIFMAIFPISFVFGNQTARLISFLSILLFYFFLSRSYERLLIISFALPYQFVFKLDPSESSLVVILIILYCLIIVSRKIRFDRTSITILVLSIPVFATLILNMDNILDFFRWIIMFVFTVLATNYTRRDELQFFLGKLPLYSISGLFSSSILALLFPNAIYRAGFGKMNSVLTSSGVFSRFSGLYNDPNFYGQLTLVYCSLALTLAYFEHIKGKMRTLTLFLVGFLMILGYLSFSKMYFFMSGFVWVLYILVSLRKTLSKRQKKNWVIWVVLLMITVILVFGMTGLSSYFRIFRVAIEGNIYRLERNEDIFSGRLSIQESLMTFFANQDIYRILFGNGLKSFGTITRGIFTMLPHNVYIEVLFALGLVGSICFVIIVTTLWRPIVSIKNNNLSWLLLLPFCILLISCLVLSGFQTFQLYIFLSFCILVTRRHLSKFDK